MPSQSIVASGWLVDLAAGGIRELIAAHHPRTRPLYPIPHPAALCAVSSSHPLATYSSCLVIVAHCSFPQNVVSNTPDAKCCGGNSPFSAQRLVLLTLQVA